MEFTSPKKPRFWTRFHDWVHRHKTASIVLAGVGLIIAAGLIATALLYRQPVKLSVTNTVPAAKKVAVKPIFYSPLTGEVVASEAITKEPVTAVMIENSPDARPQSGIKQAGVVYEAIAEGGITRFMALYQQEKPQLIGPVRSVRQYFVDWFTPYDASIAHVGGSAAALAEVRNGSYRDLDQFFNGSTYWRSTDRYAPHNVYTSFANLDALNTAKGYTGSTFTGFARQTGTASAKPTATSIAINFSDALYNTTYAYNKATNSYDRSIDGAPQMDREDGQISPATVIAMDVDMKLVLQDGYREQITTTGEGKATVFQNGVATVATWHKASQQEQLNFTDSSGKVIALDRGQTWIAAVPNQGGSVSWQ